MRSEDNWSEDRRSSLTVAQSPIAYIVPLGAPLTRKYASVSTAFLWTWLGRISHKRWVKGFIAIPVDQRTKLVGMVCCSITLVSGFRIEQRTDVGVTAMTRAEVITSILPRWNFFCGHQVNKGRPKSRRSCEPRHISIFLPNTARCHEWESFQRIVWSYGKTNGIQDMLAWLNEVNRYFLAKNFWELEFNQRLDVLRFGALYVHNWIYLLDRSRGFPECSHKQHTSMMVLCTYCCCLDTGRAAATDDETEKAFALFRRGSRKASEFKVVCRVDWENVWSWEHQHTHHAASDSLGVRNGFQLVAIFQPRDTMSAGRRPDGDN